MKLPRSLDDLRGLRAARWIRESTDDQFDRYGPDSQREQIDRFAERFGVVETGQEWRVAESGRTVWRSSSMREMLAAARRREFDVLLTGYHDRWQRNLRRFLELIEDELHPSGVALVMCDRRLLSSDPHDWDEMVREAHAAEIYSRRLGERVADGYLARFRRYADPAGSAPLGFRRRTEPPHLLEVDPATVGTAVRLFQRYSSGHRSIAQVAAEAGLAEQRVRELLRNPVYNGWAVRGSRGRRHPEQRVAAAWRADPPVSDALWERVQEVRRQHGRGGGPRRHDRLDPLAGLVHCAGCGRYLRGDGAGGDGMPRRAHLDPCEAWGSQVRYTTRTWSAPLEAQLNGVRLDEVTIARVVAALRQPRPGGEDLHRRRLARRRRDLALSHAEGVIGDAEYLAGVTALRQEEEAVPEAPTVDAGRAVARLRDFAALWAGRSAEERAEMLHAVYARVDVLGPRFAEATLTADAEEIGLALALPERVSVAMARPEGPGHPLATVRIPIAGRRDWLAAARRTA